MDKKKKENIKILISVVVILCFEVAALVLVCFGATPSLFAYVLNTLVTIVLLSWFVYIYFKALIFKKPKIR